MNPMDQSDCPTPATRVKGAVLTAAEEQQWQEVGKALAEPVIEIFPDYTQPQLKRFVRDYCDGRLYCDHQCDPNILGMVFLPLALGGLSPKAPDEKEGTEGDAAWHAAQKLPPDPGEKPKATPPPVGPQQPKYPEPPPEPIWHQVDPEREKALLLAASPDVKVESVHDLFVEEGLPAAMAEYRESIEHKNNALQTEHEAAVAEHQLVVDALRGVHDAAWEGHRVALAEHREQEARLAERKVEWQRAKAIHEATRRGFAVTRFQNLGVIYEEISKAGPRSINGQPIFWSLRIINRSDWKRAHAAITRELSRREDMEI